MKGCVEMKKIISVIIAALLLLFTCACGAEKSADENAVLYPDAATEAVSLGSGAKDLDFTAIDKNGTEYKFHIHTDKTFVGEALEELGLIEGTEGAYGMYVNKVNGIYAEYEVTGTYWAFYTDGTYALAGIDQTEITEGTEYSMIIE